MSNLEETLAYQIRICGLPKPEREYKFLPDRRFRADFAWISQRVIVELQGGLYQAKSGHRSYAGVSRDIDKHNCCVLNGWRMLYVTREHIKSGVAVQMIEEALKR